MTRTIKGVLAAGAIAIVIVIVSVSTSARAQGPVPRFEISGTSTVRGWTCPVDGVMSMTPGGGAPIPGFSDGVQSVTLTIQVGEIACPDEQMTEHLQDAMEAPSHPDIVYELDEYAVTGDTAQASGTLSVHGVTKPISLEIELVESADGRRGVGETEINMTDFGVTPPSVWGGLLNVGERVQVSFEFPLVAN
jgi:hypothetical protein